MNPLKPVKCTNAIDINNIDPKIPSTATTIPSTKPQNDQTQTKIITEQQPKISTDLSQSTWTPENKDGKKRYDRDFLLSFREKKLSNILPDAIKNNPDLILQDQNVNFFKYFLLLKFFE